MNFIAKRKMDFPAKHTHGYGDRLIIHKEVNHLHCRSAKSNAWQHHAHTHTSEKAKTK